MTKRPGLSLLFDLFAVNSAARQLLGPVMDGTGLTAEQYALYSVLMIQGPLSLTEFAERCRMPLTTASDHVRAMEERGHVKRRRNPHDGRAWLLELTPAGREQHETGRAAFAVAMRRVRAHLSLPEAEVRRGLQSLEAACMAATTDLAARDATKS